MKEAWRANYNSQEDEFAKSCGYLGLVHLIFNKFSSQGESKTDKQTKNSKQILKPESMLCAGVLEMKSTHVYCSLWKLAKNKLDW